MLILTRQFRDDWKWGESNRGHCSSWSLFNLNITGHRSNKYQNLTLCRKKLPLFVDACQSYLQPCLNTCVFLLHSLHLARPELLSWLPPPSSTHSRQFWSNKMDVLWNRPGNHPLSFFLYFSCKQAQCDWVITVSSLRPHSPRARLNRISSGGPITTVGGQTLYTHIHTADAIT